MPGKSGLGVFSSTLLIAYNLTDAGNAECFKELYGNRYIHIREKKEWLRFDGIRWVEDNQTILRMLDTVRERGKQSWGIPDDDQRKAAIKWCLSSESRMKLSAALSDSRVDASTEH